MKILFFAIALIISTTSLSFAENVFDYKTMLKNAQSEAQKKAFEELDKYLSSKEFSEAVDDAFQIADVNDDGYISENELSYIVKSVDSEFNLSDAEKAEKKSRINNYFTQFDSNHDSKLDKSEYTKIMSAETKLETEKQLKKSEELTNRIMNSANPIQESTNLMSEQIDKLKKAQEYLDKTSPDEMSNSFINSVSDNIAGENYFQMDIDKDNCVTQEEFTNYNFKNKDKDDYSKDFTKDDYANFYEDIQKSQENCLTREEYINDYNKAIDFNMENSDFIAQDFEHMDANGDSCVTEDEYINYNKNGADNAKDATDMWKKSYESIEKAQNNCLTKEEYQEDFNKPIE